MFGKKKQAGRRSYATERAQTYYYSQGKKEDKTKSTSSKGRSRFSWLHNVPAYIATFIIVCCLLYSLLLNTKPKIVIVNDQDTAVQPFLRTNDAYRDIVQRELKQSIFNRSKITFNTDVVAGKVGDALPEASDVSITLPIIGRNPVVYLRISEPEFVLVSSGASFVVDEQGRAVVPSSELPDVDFTKQLIVVTDESNIGLEAGKQAMTTDQVKFIHDVGLLLSEGGIKVSKMVLPTVVNELHVYPDGHDYYIKYNFILDAREQTGKYLAVKHQLNKQKSPPSEYVDVRVEDRAYVR